MLDYPDNMACVVWFSGCNMRCPYCHNPDIVKGKGKHTPEDVMQFLERRKGKLDGVVLSGGEITIYKDIVGFAKQIKEMGFKLKIDTNGTRPNIVKEFLDNNLLDYVAMDYKAPAYKFNSVTALKDQDFENFKKSLRMLIEYGKIPFELRTTVHIDLLQEDDINAIIDDLAAEGYKGGYYVQNYMDANGAHPTLGNLSKQSRILDISKIKSVEGITVGFRNFPEKGI